MSDAPLVTRTLTTYLRRFARDRRGATAIEYSIMAAGIGITVATTVWSVGSAMKTNFYDALAALF